ncbi:prolyl oligopeptidase family serine peptidase [Micromonospora sp. NPDC005189]|uniref:prolyl oligopeptidase family serine peptidase n=1 Tax=Micromonospora sp. NPDC005189 TaxID=3157019 RepID=UPI0033A709CB
MARLTDDGDDPYLPVVPPALLISSTRDDRVHPGHARKMAARLREHGHEVAYYEFVDGGHGAAATNEQRAFLWALTLEFLWRKLGATAQRRGASLAIVASRGSAAARSAQSSA